jgi:hypothetical protein
VGEWQGGGRRESAADRGGELSLSLSLSLFQDSASQLGMQVLQEGLSHMLLCVKCREEEAQHTRASAHAHPHPPHTCIWSFLPFHISTLDMTTVPPGAGGAAVAAAPALVLPLGRLRGPGVEGLGPVARAGGVCLLRRVGAAGRATCAGMRHVRRWGQEGAEAAHDAAAACSTAMRPALARAGQSPAARNFTNTAASACCLCVLLALLLLLCMA